MIKKTVYLKCSIRFHMWRHETDAVSIKVFSWTKSQQCRQQQESCTCLHDFWLNLSSLKLVLSVSISVMWEAAPLEFTQQDKPDLCWAVAMHAVEKEASNWSYVRGYFTSLVFYRLPTTGFYQAETRHPTGPKDHSQHFARFSFGGFFPPSLNGWTLCEVMIVMVSLESDQFRTQTQKGGDSYLSRLNY